MVKKKKRQSARYWSGRMDDIMAYIDRMDIDFFDELQSIYTENRQGIQKEIYNFYAQYAKDNKISLQEAKKRLMREDLSDYRANAEKYFKQSEKDPVLLKRLNEQYRAGKVTRLEALYLDLEWELGKMSGSLHQSFDRYLKEVAQYAYRKIVGGNSKSRLNKPALEQIVKTPFNGKNYSDSIWGNTDDLAKDLKKVLTQGFIRGSGPADMARELRKKYNVAKSRAEAIVRTDGTNVINLSAAKRFEEFGLTRYKNHVHVDSRTTDICLQINREDKSYLLTEYQPGVTAPPYHVGCRTGIVPDDKELGYEDDNQQNIIKEKPYENIIKSAYGEAKGDRKKLVEILLEKAGIEAPVEIKKINARGYNRFANFGRGHQAKIASVVLEKNDNRADIYQMKTTFHEAYHSRLQGLEVPISKGGKFTIKEWTNIEETFTETAAHYQMSLVDDASLMPAYSNYLSENLPRLQKLKGFETAESFLDFGEIAMKYRFDDSQKTADWRKMYSDINEVKFDFVKYVKDNYVEDLIEKKDEVLDMIYQNSPSFKQQHKYVEKDYDRFVEDIKTGKNSTGNEKMIGDQAVVALYRLVGVKKWK